MEREIVSKMFSLIAGEICPDASAFGAYPCALENSEAVEIFQMCEKHDVAPIVSSALKKLDFNFDSNLIKRFDDKIYSAAFRAAQQEFETERIIAVLSAAKIPFIPLKGATFKKMYPENWMRTSSDIDVLVKADDHDRATEVLCEQLGYSKDGRTAHDIALISENGVYIELHFDLVERERFPEASKVLQRVWEYAHPDADNEFLYLLRDEFVYFYHIVHMAKHIFNGGCGIKPFIDLYILESIEHSLECRDRLLCEGGLLKFAEVSRSLVKVWFCGEKGDDVLQTLEDYVLDGGVYGTLENNVAANRNKYGSKLNYYFGRLFLPKRLMISRYPCLNSRPWLLPACYLHRMFGVLSSDSRQRLKHEIKFSNQLSQESIDNFANLISQIGL